MQGFYHPDRGYWQTQDDAAKEIIDAYPEGTVKVPLRPLGDFNWDGTKWVEADEDIDVAAQRERAKRDLLLAETDWMALSDVTMTPEQAKYRQSLRDVPSQKGFPKKIRWPSLPQ